MGRRGQVESVNSAVPVPSGRGRLLGCGKGAHSQWEWLESFKIGVYPCSDM